MELRQLTIRSAKVYSWYKSAMASRRPGSELPYDNFCYHTSSVMAWGDIKQGFIFGEIRKGVFCPSHFAPRTKKSGVRLIKSLMASDYLVAFAVTEDLAVMFRRMENSFNFSNMEFHTVFRNTPCKKVVFTNCGLLADRIQKLIRRISRIKK